LNTSQTVLLRQLYQYQNQVEKNPIDFEVTIERYVAGIAKNGFPISKDETKFEYIQELLQPYNITINNSNWTKVDANTLIYNKGTELNTIYEEIYIMRNENLKATIEKSLGEYDRVFIIMGRQHLLDEKDTSSKKIELISFVLSIEPELSEVLTKISVSVQQKKIDPKILSEIAAFSAFRLHQHNKKEK